MRSGAPSAAFLEPTARERAVSPEDREQFTRLLNGDLITWWYDEKNGTYHFR